MTAEPAGFTRRYGVLVAGAAACLACLLVAAVVGAQGWRAWLGATVLWIGCPIGALGLWMMARLIPGAWQASVGAPAEGLSRTFPIGAALLVPVLVAAPALYPWAGAAQTTAFRRFYLSVGMFDLRAVAVLAAFMVLLVLLKRQGPPGRVVAAVGLLVYVPLTTLAAVDWVLSLDPAFASSGFGLYLLCLQMLTALALGLVPGSPFGAGKQTAAAGAVLLSALLLWAYFSFMQYFIVWSGNLPPGVAWYQRRGHGLWQAVIWTAAATRLVPTVLLLFSRFRRTPRLLSILAAVIAAGSVLEVAWLVIPPAGSASLALYGLFVVAMGLLGLGWLKTPALRPGTEGGR